MKAPESFSNTLVRMLQAGSLEQILGCPVGQRAQVEFQITHRYRVHLTPKTMVVQEQEEEHVRRYAHRRLQPVRRAIFPRGRIIVDRRTKQMLQAPRLGIARPVVSLSPQQPAPRRRRATAVAA